MILDCQAFKFQVSAKSSRDTLCKMFKAHQSVAALKEALGLPGNKTFPLVYHIQNGTFGVNDSPVQSKASLLTPPA